MHSDRIGAVHSHRRWQSEARPTTYPGAETAIESGGRSSQPCAAPSNDQRPLQQLAAMLGTRFPLRRCAAGTLQERTAPCERSRRGSPQAGQSALVPTPIYQADATSRIEDIIPTASGSTSVATVQNPFRDFRAVGNPFRLKGPGECSATMHTILVGQCGNQLGAEFWSLLASETKSTAPYYFHLDGSAKCVCIDSEPKVIRSILEAKGSPTLISPRNCVMEASGRGNNWAMGFYGPRRKTKEKEFIHLGVEKKSLLASSLDLLRREFERYDRSEPCVMFHSIAGGTGSGFGSRLMQELKDSFQHMTLMNVSVGPYTSGEIPLQYLNSVLSLAHLQQFSDAVLYFSNEQLMHLLARDLQAERMPVRFKGSYVRLSTADINSYIAACLAGVFLPCAEASSCLQEPADGDTAKSAAGRGGKAAPPQTKRIRPAAVSSYSSSSSSPLSPSSFSATASIRPFEAWDFISSVCPDRRRKFVEVRTAPILGSKEKLQSWEYLAEQLTHLAPRFLNSFTGRAGGNDRPIQSMCSQLIVRGDTQGQFMQDKHGHRDEVMQILSRSYTAVPWNPMAWDIRVSRANAYSFRSPPVASSLTVASNRSNIVPQLMTVVLRARQSLRHRTYVHWYEQYGVDSEMLEEACNLVEQTAWDYML